MGKKSLRNVRENLVIRHDTPFTLQQQQKIFTPGAHAVPRELYLTSYVVMIWTDQRQHFSCSTAPMAQEVKWVLH